MVAVDDSELLRRALVSPPAGQRAAVVLRHREGLSAAQEPRQSGVDIERGIA